VSFASCNIITETQSINNQNDTTMATSDFTTTVLVDQTPREAFDAINNVRGWWSEEVEGTTDRLHGEFTYHYKDVHISRMKLVEFVPDKKVVWLVLDNHFNFTKDKREWKNTKISFEISEKDNQTEIRFTHIGLTPEYECYDICRDAWSNYIKNSLRDLITTGTGKPNPKEGGFNQQLIEEYMDGKQQTK
jgi:hypothetical protein